EDDVLSGRDEVYREVAELAQQRRIVHVVVEVLEDEEGGLLVGSHHVQRRLWIRRREAEGRFARGLRQGLVTPSCGPGEQPPLPPLTRKRLEQPLQRPLLLRRDQRDQR